MEIEIEIEIEMEMEIEIEMGIGDSGRAQRVTEAGLVRGPRLRLACGWWC